MRELSNKEKHEYVGGIMSATLFWVIGTTIIMGFSAITSFGLKVAEEGAYQNALKNIANNAATQPISSWTTYNNPYALLSSVTRPSNSYYGTDMSVRVLPMPIRSGSQFNFS